MGFKTSPPTPLLVRVEDPDDTTVEEVKASLRKALQQASSGRRLPLSQMWEDITS